MSLPQFPHFTLFEAGPGVYAALAGDTGACISNTAIIDLGDRTLILDTFQTVQAAEDLRAAAMALTGRSADLTVISHWHGDHYGGSQVFDDAPILSTARTCEIIAGKDPGNPDAYIAGLESALEQAWAALETSTDPVVREHAEGTVKTVSLLREAAPGFRFTGPSPIDGDGMTSEGSDRRVEIMSLGRGHTESDLFVHVPDAGVVVTGDLLWVGRHPRVNDGFPAAWVDVLGQIEGLGARTLVSGHGGIGGAADVHYLRRYLRAIDEIVDEAVLTGLDDDALARIPVPPGSETWGDLARFRGSIVALVARRREGSR